MTTLTVTVKQPDATSKAGRFGVFGVRFLPIPMGLILPIGQAIPIGFLLSKDEPSISDNLIKQKRQFFFCNLSYSIIKIRGSINIFSLVKKKPMVFYSTTNYSFLFQRICFNTYTESGCISTNKRKETLITIFFPFRGFFFLKNKEANNILQVKCKGYIFFISEVFGVDIF